VVIQNGRYLLFQANGLTSFASPQGGTFCGPKARERFCSTAGEVVQLWRREKAFCVLKLLAIEESGGIG